MADTEATGLERQEQAADNAVFGAGSALGAGNDIVLLERSETNKVTAGSIQSELRIAWIAFYRYLDTRDNMLDKDGTGINDHVRHYREESDPRNPTSGHKIRVYFQIPYWDWMISVFDDNVIEHQLTLWGYSREQFLKHSVDVASLTRNQGDGQGGLFQQINSFLSQKGRK